MERIDLTRPLRAAMEERRDEYASDTWDDRLDAIKGETASMKLTEGEAGSEPTELLRLIATAAAAMSKGIWDVGLATESEGEREKCRGFGGTQQQEWTEAAAPDDRRKGKQDLG